MKKMEDNFSLAGLEEKLEFSLRRVEPDPKFVGVVRRRLTAVPAVSIETSSHWLAFLVVSFGLFSGALLIWLLRRLWLLLR